MPSAQRSRAEPDPDQMAHGREGDREVRLELIEHGEIADSPRRRRAGG